MPFPEHGAFMLKLLLPLMLLATACNPDTTQNVEQGSPNTFVCTMPDGRQFLHNASSSDVTAACVLFSDEENQEDTSPLTRSTNADAAKAPNGTLAFPDSAP